MLHNGYLRLSCLIIILFMVLPCSLFVYRSEERRSVFRGDIRDEDFETANPSNLVHGSGDYGEFREGPGYRMSIDSMGASHLELTVIPGNVSKNDVTADGKVYTRVCIPGSSLTGNVGRPELPALLLTLAVPTQDIDIDVIASESHRIRTNDIYPLQPPLIDSGIGIPERFTVDSVWYDSPEPYPEGMVEISQNGKLRDVDFVRLNVNPVSVSPGFRGIEVLDSITLRLSWKAGTGATRSGGTCTPVEPAFEPLYRSIFSDWTEYKDLFVNGDERRGAVKDPTDLPADAEGAEYLIIADPGLESAAVPLRQWKTERGIITTIVNTTETGNTAEDIRLYLEDAYDNWTVRPSYVLLLGDADHIPTNYEYTHPYHGTLTGSDHWYTTLSGADYYSDIHIGRMPVDDLAQAELLVGKAINYEKNPPTEDHYYTNASMAGYFQDGAPYSGTKDGYEDRRFILTSEEIRDYLMSIGKNVERIYCAEGGATPTHYNDGSYANGEALPAELLRANGFGWDDGTAEVTNSVNDGVFILNHRDHGARWGWGDPHFDTGDINALSNGDLQPVVYSINCQTGWFDHETDGDAGTTTESFCEVFVRKENGGAANCIGATRVSYSGHNDYMARGFYDAVFPDFDAGVGTSTAFYHIGEIMDYGKSYMAATWGDPWGIEQLEFELFHVFGDPHMELWTSKPTALSVSHPEMIDENATSVRVNVSEDGAFVSLESGGEIIGRGSVSGGFADVILAAAPSKNITVTVTKHDRLPYQAELLVFFDNSSDTGTTGDAFQFIIGGLDDIDVDSVYINWSHGGLLGNVSLSEDSGNWSGPAVLDHSLQLLNYTVLVNDTHNNWNVSDERSANVTDNDEPTLDSDDSPDTGTTGDNYVFDVTISDNIDVDKAYTNWTHGALSGNDSMTDDGDGTWSLTIVLENELGEMT